MVQKKSSIVSVDRDAVKTFAVQTCNKTKHTERQILPGLHEQSTNKRVN